MGRTLIVAATEIEVKGLMSSLKEDEEFEFLITGVGMINTCFILTKRLSIGGVDKVVNVGIAGAFDKKLELGQVVQIVTERFSEFGAEDNGSFLKADEMNLMSASDLDFKTHLRFSGLEELRGITVNTIHGEEQSIRKVVDLFNPEVESMEGAAVALVAEKFGVEWAQIRAISNYLEPRNRDSWQIELAINKLCEVVTKILSQV